MGETEQGWLMCVRRAAAATAGALALTMLVAPPSGAASSDPVPGSLDSTFGSQGVSRLPWGGSATLPSYRYRYRFAEAPDGKIMISEITDRGDIGLARFTAGMDRDTSFGSGGILTLDLGSSDDALAGIVMQADGKTLVAGSSGSSFFVERLLADGSVDTSFGQAGRASATFPRHDDHGTVVPGAEQAKASALAIDPATGALAVVGSVGDRNYQRIQVGVARFTGSGQRDAGFGGGSGVAVGFDNDDWTGIFDVPSASFDSQHRLVVASIFDQESVEVSRVTAAGTADAGFGTNGTVRVGDYEEDHVKAGAVAGDRVLVASAGTVRRYTAAGVLDTAYGTNGVASLDASIDFLPLADGSALGLYYDKSDTFEHVKRVTPSGQIDSSWNSIQLLDGIGLFATAAGYDAVSEFGRESLGPNGGYLGEHTGSVVTAFPGLSAVGRQLIRRPSGGFIALVTRTAAGPARLVGVTGSGAVDPGFGTTGSVDLPAESNNVRSRLIAIDGSGRTLTVATAQTGNSTFSVIVRRYTAPGAADPSFGSGGKTVLTTLTTALAAAYQPGHGLLIGGSNDDDQGRLVRLTDAGALDTTFATGGIYALGSDSGSISHVLVDGSARIYALGGTGSQILRLTAAGALDDGFGTHGVATDVSSSESALTLLPSGGVAYLTYDGRVAELTSSGQPDSKYFVDDAGALGSLSGLDPQLAADADGRVVVAYSSQGRFVLRRFNLDGSLDASFGDQGTAITALGDGAGGYEQPNDVLIEPDGHIVSTGGADGDAVILRQQGGGAVGPLGDPILDVTGGEATVGATDHVRFTISLSRASAQSVSIHAKTADGAAKAGVDYTPVEVDVTIPPGALSTAVDVPIRAHPGAYDYLDMSLQLDAVQHTRMRESSGQGTIHQVPAAPALIDAPSLYGPLDPGDDAWCESGTWSGTQPQQIVITWLRDGSPIAGETKTEYRVGNADAGHSLTCRVSATNALGSASATAAAVSVSNATDTVAPTITISTPADGSHIEQGDSVYALFSCSDGAGSGVDTCTGSAGYLDTSAVGQHSFTVTASDRIGNTASKTVHYFVDGFVAPDTTAPTINITVPTEGQHVAQGDRIASQFSCDDGTGGGVASCSGPDTIDTVDPGRTTFTVTARDASGNTRTLTIHYEVDARQEPIPTEPAAATPTPAPTPGTAPSVGSPPPATSGKPPAPSVAAPTKAKLSALGKSVATTVTGLKPKSTAALTVRLGAKKLATFSAKADASGRATLKLKLTSKQRKALRRKQTLTLTYVITSATGKRETVVRKLTVS